MITAEYPGVRVVVRAGATADQVVEAVRTGRTELGLLAGVRLPHEPGVGLHPVARQRFVVVTSAAGPFGPGTRVGPADLSGLRVIAGQTGTGMRAVVAELDPPVYLEVAFASHAGGLGPAARIFLDLAIDWERRSVGQEADL